MPLRCSRAFVIIRGRTNVLQIEGIVIEKEVRMFLFYDKDESAFENIKKHLEDGIEFWYARDLQDVLEYTEWRNFKKVIDKAKTACGNSGTSIDDHFVDVNKMVQIGSGADRIIDDIQLSRYACYLIVQNGDPRKEIIAIGQTYFAVKTRQQEVVENYDVLTEEKLRRDNIRGKNEANKTHFEVGAKVRQTIKELGGTMPEDLPTPEKSIQQIEKEQMARLKSEKDKLLLDE